MKVSDYIVNYFIEKGVTHVFGYPGGMVTHLMDSLEKQKDKIFAPVLYHEQGAALAACGYAQATGKVGVAYATSGPGATNLLTGIANAYFDSIPTIFITGQVNTYEQKGNLPIRQKGFQETDVVRLVSGITKYAVSITNESNIRYELEKAYAIATSGRKGPVVLDIPMNIQRAEIEVSALKQFKPRPKPPLSATENRCETIVTALQNAKRPVILIGAGIAANGMNEPFLQWLETVQIPVVSSMLAVDVCGSHPFYYGFIGAYGHRTANFLIAKSDCVLSLGSRLDVRQTGSNAINFAENATLIRVDIDKSEFENRIKENEIQIHADLKALLPKLCTYCRGNMFDYADWRTVCDTIKCRLNGIDDGLPNEMIRGMSELVPRETIVTTDVGQNQVWTAQSFAANGQRILFSGGHGAMGYALPAAIGAHYGTKKQVVCFTGDGGFQMNLQELQCVSRDGLPIKIVLLNNESLGMIRHFQEMYFDNNYAQTVEKNGYTTPSFQAIAQAYRLPYKQIHHIAELKTVQSLLENDEPCLIELFIGQTTHVFPKLAMNKPNQDQEPLLPRAVYNELMCL